MTRSRFVAAVASLCILGAANAHISPWTPGMYCKNGLSNIETENVNEPVNPLWNLTFNDWWFHGACKNFPPPDGEFLDFPAGGNTTVELAGNKGQTTLAFNGSFVSDWPDGKQHPEYTDGSWPPRTCIISPNLHAFNESDTAGSVFAISYNSDLAAVTPQNLVVFTVLPHTPFKRLATYQVPAGMPACPPGGCICAWGWVPNNCGEPNMYMTGFRCRITGASPSASALAAPAPPTWCEGASDKCTPGAKQMVFWHQLDGNNVFTNGTQADGQAQSPGYNMKLGFAPGPQNNIFATSGSGGSGTKCGA